MSSYQVDYFSRDEGSEVVMDSPEDNSGGRSKIIFRFLQSRDIISKPTRSENIENRSACLIDQPFDWDSQLSWTTCWVG
jgi:hypothetical protein